MITFPNQRTVKIFKERVKNVKNSNRHYICMYTDNLNKAMQNLTGAELKIYLYLMSQQNYYQMAYSSEACSKATGVCVESCRKLFNSLKNKGYLIPTNEKETMFHFVEEPSLKAKINSDEEEKWTQFEGMVKAMLKGKSKEEQQHILNVFNISTDVDIDIFNN